MSKTSRRACVMCNQLHKTVKLDVKEYSNYVFNYLHEEVAGGYLPCRFIDDERFELDEFLDVMVEYVGKNKEHHILINEDMFGKKYIHGTRRKIETNDMMHRDIIKAWLWDYIKHRTDFAKSRPALWDYLKRQSQGFILGVEQGCY